MYSVRHEAGASGEPSYKGYKAMLVLLALAILAIVVGLLLVGGGDDDGGSLGSDPGDVTVSYSGAETNDLHRIEPTLDGAPITIQVRPEFYALAEPLRRS